MSIVRPASGLIPHSPLAPLAESKPSTETVQRTAGEAALSAAQPGEVSYRERALGSAASVAKLAGPVPTSKLGAIAFASAALDEDFLRFSPPAEKKAFLRAVKEAVGGAFGKLRDAARWVRALGSPEAAVARAKAALESHSAGTEGGESLGADERRVIRELLEGPVAQALAEAGHPAPRSLEEVISGLSDAKVRDKLITLREAAMVGPGPVGAANAAAAADVDAAIAVASAVVKRMREHLEVTVVDQRFLAGNKLDGEKVKALPPALRIPLEDPAMAPLVEASLLRGEVISAQVLRKTPEHVIEGLREVSRMVAGGSFLWVDEYLRTGKRPAISKGDLLRARASLDGAATGVDRVIQKVASKLLDSGPSLSSEERTLLSEALGAKDRAAALAGLADRLRPRAEAGELDRLARAASAAEELRKADPEGLFSEVDKRLDEFEAFRAQGLNVRVHGGSSVARGLEGRLRKHPVLSEYRSAVLEHTVGADYANEAADGAKKIVVSVAALSLVGVPIERYLGESVMTSILSTVEDVLGWGGEAASLRGQGVSWSDILLGARNIGLLPVLGSALWAAGSAEAAIAAGKGWQAGAGVAWGACALTIYTTLSSYLLFHKVGRRMVSEGKLEDPGSAAEARGTLSAVAERIAELAPKDSRFVADLERAFDAVAARQQGVPDGRAVSRAFGELRPNLETKVLDAVAVAYDDIGALLRSGVDVEDKLKAVSASLAQKVVLAAKSKGLSLDEKSAARASQEIRATLEKLEGPKELHPDAVLRVANDVLICFAKAAHGGKLTDAESRAVMAGAELAKEGYAELEKELGQKLSPELEKLARSFAMHQVFANPVRKRLAQGVAWCIGLSLLTGIAAPALLHLPLTIAALGSMESISTAVALKIGDIRHRRALTAIGERFLDQEATQRGLSTTQAAPA
ncbi:MAG: hypothetical protein HY791_35770 [Deltaproteobacteria bacterium]|nr:hypothetical protein [Deltaproteobacteria bacterium]